MGFIRFHHIYCGQTQGRRRHGTKAQKVSSVKPMLVQNFLCAWSSPEGTFFTSSEKSTLIFVSSFYSI